MTPLGVIAAVVVFAAVAFASVLGLCAHLLWLVATDPRALVELTKAALGL